MRGPPRSLQEWLYYKLLESPSFHKFVGNIYRKVNGIKDVPPPEFMSDIHFLYTPTRKHKFKAFRMLFFDEYRTFFGFSRKTDKFF
ncbi:Mrx7p NDAI_0F03640 [Naumovozyma dairenensis CBS 421]|uniref:Uncharacterized protein n=1 Tax=Naumovozyma dairenensis (strain ATCC 10597 / BCRC 20456 / CBS 421 / NBRC 0211 / NRRL Y-12639) TaxID=1071378 RepID=G0WD21_NAUDC|nr:hypothetical protein NDAI_0F03640 [Naumovozyma dairenensis CBS 421]CCD25682.1 hypothetical protein NDAI_0F03640 [Naumovozyma dairenensis CBS 421]